MSGETGERIGVFGGTFDPPHVGHIVAAVNVRHGLALDRVLMVPASIPWQKSDFRAVSAAEDRLAMLHAAVDGVEGLSVSTIELERGGESYTADTLEALHQRTTDDREGELFMIVGSDVAPSLDTWKRPEVLRRLATIVVYDRPGSAGGQPPQGWRWTPIAVPQLDVSSTEVRRRVTEQRPIDGMVNPTVARHIRSRGLYRSNAGEAMSAAHA